MIKQEFNWKTWLENTKMPRTIDAERIINRIIFFLNIKKNSVILDAGCGMELLHPY